MENLSSDLIPSAAAQDQFTSPSLLPVVSKSINSTRQRLLLEGKTMVLLVYGCSITQTTTPHSSLVRMDTILKRSAMNQRTNLFVRELAEWLSRSSVPQHSWQVPLGSTILLWFSCTVGNGAFGFPPDRQQQVLYGADCQNGLSDRWLLSGFT